MVDEVAIRRATTADVDFLVEAICAAEKGGTDKLSFAGIFEMSESGVVSALSAMLLEDLEGQELCISGFLIAESGGRPLAACCAWVEGSGELSSSLLKANLLLYHLGGDKIRAAKRHFRALDALTIPRASGAIQIESVYARPEARGRGLTGRLIERHLAELGPTATAGKVQVILNPTNLSAVSAYAKLGFVPKEGRSSDDATLRELLPSTQKVCMEKPLTGAIR